MNRQELLAGAQSALDEWHDSKQIPVYEKRGNRISLLPVTQFCGYAAKLSEEHGAGRPAAMSKAFHALQAAPGATETLALLAALSEEERQQIALWPVPTDVHHLSGTLRYADADKELPVGLDERGNFVESGDCLTSGTLDMAWVLGQMAHIGDIKKSKWTVPGPDTLQLQAYGWAYARKKGLTKFTTGLFIAEDGEWVWSDRVIDMESFEGMELWERIKHAGSNKSLEPATGDHCSICYGRLHCKEHLAPVEFAETWLAPIAGAEVTSEQVVDMLLKAQRIEGLIEKVKEHAKELTKRGVKLVHPESGKVFKATECKGRESMNVPLLLQEMPTAARYIRRGNPYFRAMWGKP